MRELLQAVQTQGDRRRDRWAGQATQLSSRGSRRRSPAATLRRFARTGRNKPKPSHQCWRGITLRLKRRSLQGCLSPSCRPIFPIHIFNPVRRQPTCKGSSRRRIKSALMRKSQSNGGAQSSSVLPRDSGEQRTKP